jgi:hypothetical protein
VAIVALGVRGSAAISGEVLEEAGGGRGGHVRASWVREWNVMRDA